MTYTPNPRSAPTIVSGAREPGSGVPSQRIIPDVRDQIILWEPEAAPLIAMTKKLRDKMPASQRQFDWIEEEPYPRVTTVNGAQTSGDTTVELATGTGSRYQAGDLLRNRRTGEVILVSSLSTDAATVVRGIGSSGGIAMNDGDEVELIAQAYADGATSGTSKTVKGGREYNYTQIFRRPYQLTGRQENTAMFGGRDIKTTGRQAAVEHKKDIELAAFFGRRYNDAGSPERTATGGLDQFIASNIWDLNNVLPTEAAFIDFLEQPMRWGQGGVERGNGMKALFCSPRWLSLFWKWWRDTLRVVDAPEITKLGLNVSEVVTPHGTIMLVRQPLFQGSNAGLAYLVDLNHITYRPHQGRDTELHENIQDNDYDGVKHEWFTDAGFEVQVEGAHAKILGLPAIA